mmetsp:Transcript_53594/g.135360  ORF Transcript_53594/g.135360 Transcript_53594/m.135360 type:complete len:329 (+) Transcript_53594:61-1047(+)|eukprot:CAMPEP_0115210984 /NCGR_PEP_ID=MMETSP0270-20121206/22529_1 /TAXON_ID=71861 /ORGANISM="Scrippsiella trochoidea, Strain CCMP3099" /LENGTH=328 /DNA_ID=CAMNT_0002624657 /DNA_START=60 /DNA_END=1046 /DNA_ORIENTATION=-
MPDFFQIDVGQSGWRPSGLQALAGELSRAFETKVAPDEVEFLGFEGASTAGEILSSDEAVAGFCGSKEDSISETDTVDTASSKVIKAELPERIASELRRPRKLALLAGGHQLAKYTGEADGRDFSLKVFDCGHFRVKEALASGSSPSSSRGAVFEGRWDKTAKGVRLELLLRQVEQQSRRRPSDASVTYEAVPPEVRQTNLTFVGGSEERLQGQLPTFGEEAMICVELHKEADMVVKQTRARREEQDDDDDWECRQMLKPQVQQRPPPRVPPRPKPYRDWDDDHWDSDEPTWPMYLGIFLFIVIFCVFAWLWYEERYSPEAKKEFDEL